MRFKVNYSDGWGTSFGAGFSGHAVNACTPYTGPVLTHVVVACDAPDGSFWVLQKWRRALPDGGWTPTAAQDAPEFHLSHWSGDLPELVVDTDWIYGGRFDHIFGYLHYRDSGVYGFSATNVGNPLDSYGRNLYVDVHDPPWARAGTASTRACCTARPASSAWACTPSTTAPTPPRATSTARP